MLNFLNIPTEFELIVNLVFLAITGAVAWHGIRFRDDDGNAVFVHLLFGCIASLFFFAVLFQDILGLVSF
jgi:hypothetical protein